MQTLITNIKELLQVREPDIKQVSGSEMKILPTIKNAYLLIENDLILDYGKMEDLNGKSGDIEINANGKIILPSWCDSHTHIVYAGNRESEFVDRINGLSYEEIAAKGGGILNSAQRLQEISEDELYAQSANRLEEIMALGTGAIEIKSGYGLTTESELKMLRVIQRLKDSYPVDVKATFLGAHAFPQKYKEHPAGYIDLLINEMLPKVAETGIVEFIDVFCEQGYFSTTQTDQILAAGQHYGLQPKIHVNQFSISGGISVAVKHKALSVDHLELLDANDIDALRGSETMPVALPTCSYFLGLPYTPARTIIDAGLPLALASDYNPGSTPSGNMNFVLSTACIKMNMTPEEAINAATINGAYAMNLSESHGSITKGKKANFIITKEIPSYAFLPYAFGSNNIDSVYLNGERFE